MNEISTLERLDLFAMLRWGKEKWQVMRVGQHQNNEGNEWKIGEMTINENETKSYKYLGDIVTDDKTISTTISIKTIASNDIFREMGDICAHGPTRDHYLICLINKLCVMDA